MAHGGLQVLGLVLSLAGWGALVAAAVLPQWQMSSFAGDTIITAVVTYQGLWMSCASQSTGQLQCKSYDSILALPGYIQVTRALMVVAGVLGPLAMGVAVMGMKCTRCGGDDPRRKAGMAAAGGGLFLLSGLAGLIACSWYGHRIVTNFYDPTVPVNYKFEFGTAIFMGWGGAALALLGGAMLACSCPRRGGHGRAYPRSKAASPQPPSNREYV
ncbi:claudin-7 [Haliaeetus albicilla]|uniref:claudin-7 n=1 Tax=Haliaeetus albicilla TaxID=8969 RepID=UPI0037E880BA